MTLAARLHASGVDVTGVTAYASPIGVAPIGLALSLSS